MQIELIGTAILCDQPRAAADWFIEHFGFELGVDIDWYVNVQHPRHRNHSLDFLASEHGSLPEGLRGHTVGGTLLAFLVEDVEAEERRLRAAGQKVVLPLAREPWVSTASSLPARRACSSRCCSACRRTRNG